MTNWLRPKIGAPISHDVGAKADATVAKVGAELGSYREVWDEKGVRHEVGHVGTLGVPAHLVCRVRHEE